MSLAIQTDQVTHVLLADGWHAVHGQSFGTDSYEYLSGDNLAHNDGTGFGFRDNETGAWIYGPMTSILAVMSSR